jgi:hypothetical protein
VIVLVHQSDMSPPKFLAGGLVASLKPWVGKFLDDFGVGYLVQTDFMFMHFNLIYPILVG